jgi:hypothetical protein
MPERSEAIHRMPALSVSVIGEKRVSGKVELAREDGSMSNSS